MTWLLLSDVYNKLIKFINSFYFHKTYFQLVSNVTLMETLLCLNRFIVPISCVICNDIMAYMFGFFFGRTPLIKVGCLTVMITWVLIYVMDTRIEILCGTWWCIKLVSTLCSLQLSPKKTWEGFIGGFFATIVFGIMVRRDFYLISL